MFSKTITLVASVDKFDLIFFDAQSIAGKHEPISVISKTRIPIIGLPASVIFQYKGKQWLTMSQF